MPAEQIDLHALFNAAIAFDSSEEQASFLEEACGSNPALRQRIDALLRAHSEAGGFFGGKSPVPVTTEIRVTAETVGASIGPYKLLEQIGEGGFGTVYMAEQRVPLCRKVALKILKPGMDSRQVLTRFEAERQTLAIMDHPNIARVLDAGTTAEGRPYFVMELVRGIPVTEYCDKQRLTTDERLKLFVDICCAVQHAHQMGIIHRDIKPTNILVAEYDERPVPKVIDFGVAKAISRPLTDETMVTGFGQIVGTLEYMSPEQARFNQLDIDTRSDVYSLGAVMYELLTGSTPFDKVRLRLAAWDEMLRIIREDDPPMPSTKLSNSDTLPDVAVSRSTEPARLTRSIHGELDWIVMKALEKDRNRRYQTANELCADVRRYLDNDAVQACPPSSWYRFRKFALRNKSILASASAVGLALLLAVATLAASTAQIAREKRLTANALQAETRANENLRRDGYFHRIALAHRELSADKLGRALELLDECPPELREWEWRYLRRLCQVEPVILQDDTAVNSLAFSPDGQRIASAGADGTVKIWNRRTGEVQTIEQAHDGFVSSVAFHPYGQHVCSVGADRKMKVWDLTTTEFPVFEGPCSSAHVFGSAYAVAFRPPDGRHVAAGIDGAVMVWDWRNSQLLHRLAEHESRPTNVLYHSRMNVAFSHDGRHLASGSWQGRVSVWDVEAGGEPAGSFSETYHPIPSLAFADDGRLATANFDRRVDLWDTTTGELACTVRQPGLVQCVAFSPDGKRLASGGEDKTIHVWDATTGQEVLSLRGHTGLCTCVVFSPDGHRLASASSDKTVRIWDATPLQKNEGQEAPNFTHNDEVWSLAVSPNGRHVVSAGWSMPARVWDIETRQVSAEFAGHTRVEFCVAWHPDGERIASAGIERDGLQFTATVWDARSGQPTFALTAPQEYLAAAFSPDGRYLATGGADRTVRIWDARTGAGGYALGPPHNSWIRGLAFSRAGGRLASASADGTVKLWDATRLDEEQEPRHTLPARVHGPSLNIAFSPDGQRLAAGGEENTIKIWDVETGRELQSPLRGHSGDVYTVAFSPDADGRWIASGGEDSTVKLWDSHTGTLVRTLRGHTGLVSSVAFSPDGRRLFSGSRDHTVKIWDVADVTRSAHAPDR